MKDSTKLRLIAAQLIMVLSFLLFVALEIHDHHGPTYLYWIDAVVTAFLSFLIPTDNSAYYPRREDETE